MLIPKICDIVSESHYRIKNYIHQTPIIFSSTLNNMMKSNIYFKMDSLQKTGSFKVRGVLNHLLVLKEENRLPKKFVTYSTGNHGIALAWVTRLLGLNARIYLPKYTSILKQQIVKHYGAELVLTNTRKEAEYRSFLDNQKGFYYLHPSNSDLTIAGAGTMCYEALQQMCYNPDVIFASCGGGGLISGSYLAKSSISPSSMLIGCEPSTANDAFLSIKNNRIFKFNSSPSTIADGLKALSISPRTFHYLKKVDDFFLVEEEEIYYWVAWLYHLLGKVCEPSAAINMAAVSKFLKKHNCKKNILVLISGGNIDYSIYKELWKKKYLKVLPNYKN